MAASQYSDFGLYLRYITPNAADPTYSILKAHLLFEEMLRDYLSKVLPHPQSLDGARLSFAQLLAIARAITKHPAPESWHWHAISELNRIRNLMAHHLESKALEQKINGYIEHIVSSTGVALPPPAVTLSQEQTIKQSQPLYQAVDMVTAALFMFTAATFGLVPEEVLASRRAAASGNNESV